MKIGKYLVVQLFDCTKDPAYLKIICNENGQILASTTTASDGWPPASGARTHLIADQVLDRTKVNDYRSKILLGFSKRYQNKLRLTGKSTTRKLNDKIEISECAIDECTVNCFYNCTFIQF